MSVFRKITGVVSTSLLLISGSLYGATPNHLDWKTLHYSGSKFFISLDAKVGFSYVDAIAAQQALYQTAEGNGVLPAQDKAVLLTTESSVLGNHSRFKTWLDTDLRALERSAVYSGRKDWVRVYRYFPDRVYGLKAKPVDKSEAGKPWFEWSNRSEGYFPIEAQARELILTEPMGLFYLLRIREFKQPGDKQTFYVFDRDGTVAVNLQAQAWEKIKVDYKRLESGSSNRVKDKINVLRLTVDAKPISPEKTEAEFDFMGYKDSINLFYDPVTRVVLRVSGSVEYVGNVEINLEQAEF